MQILDDEKQRPSRRQASKELHEGLEEAAFLLFWLGCGTGQETWQKGGEFREQLDKFRSRGTQGSSDLVRGTRGEEGAQRIQQGCIRESAIGFKAPTPEYQRSRIYGR